MTHCTIKKGIDGPPWISIRVGPPAVPIDSLNIYRFEPGGAGGIPKLVPYEVCGPSLTHGSAHSHTVYFPSVHTAETPCAACGAQVWVGVDDYGERRTQCSLPERADPGDYGIPAIAQCGGAVGAYVTLFRSGTSNSYEDNILYASELRVFSPSPPPASALRPPPLKGEVLRNVNARYEEARPSSLLSESGVFVHIFE